MNVTACKQKYTVQHLGLDLRLISYSTSMHSVTQIHCLWIYHYAILAEIPTYVGKPKSKTLQVNYKTGLIVS